MSAGQRVKPSRTEFAPEYQRTRYVADGVTISKTVFVPVFGEQIDIVFVIVEAHNGGKEPQTLGVSGDIRYPEFGWAEYVKFPDPFQRSKRVNSEQSQTLVISRTKGKENEVRVIGGGIAIAEARMDDQGASLVFEPVVLQPDQSVTLPFAMAISPNGAEEALMTLAQIEHHRDIFYQTQEYFGRVVVNTCQVATPDPVINRAVAWAKVNSFRQRTKYPIGYGFTNDPPQDVVVVRDAAWFVFGSDYFLPDFSRDMLSLVQQYGVEEGGKLTEYINCCECPPYHYDYDLNINDDTPLFIYAVHHHYCATKNDQFLRDFYPTDQERRRLDFEAEAGRPDLLLVRGVQRLGHLLLAQHHPRLHAHRGRHRDQRRVLQGALLRRRTRRRAGRDRGRRTLRRKRPPNCVRPSTPN